jgi:hypothetical protein
MTTRDRLHQCLLLGSFLPLCWLGMMAVHEFGHCLAAWASGGGVERVVLHPLTISRTDVTPNPRPLLVTWAGPAFGSLAPVLIMALLVFFAVPGSHFVRFFAGFCRIANGAYLGLGSFDHIGDAGDLLRHGAAAWQLWLFGVLTVPAGFWLWHGQGKHFGLGRDAHPVTQRATWIMLGLLVVLVIAEVALSPMD